MKPRDRNEARTRVRCTQIRLLAYLALLMYAAAQPQPATAPDLVNRRYRGRSKYPFDDSLVQSERQRLASLGVQIVAEPVPWVDGDSWVIVAQSVDPGRSLKPGDTLGVLWSVKRDTITRYDTVALRRAHFAFVSEPEFSRFSYEQNKIKHAGVVAVPDSLGWKRFRISYFVYAPSVPSLRGLSRQQAEDALKALDLALVKTAKSDDYGVVVEQNPDSGQQTVSQGAVVPGRHGSVEVRLCAGAYLPNLVGKDEASATEALGAVGARWRLKRRAVLDSTQWGRVIEQSPPEWTPVADSATVVITVGKKGLPIPPEILIPCGLALLIGLLLLIPVLVALGRTRRLKLLVAAGSSGPAPESALRDRMDEVSSQMHGVRSEVARLQTALAGIQTEVGELSARPLGEVEQATSRSEDELRQQLSDLSARVDALAAAGTNTAPRSVSEPSTSAPDEASDPVRDFNAVLASTATPAAFLNKYQRRTVQIAGRGSATSSIRFRAATAGNFMLVQHGSAWLLFPMFTTDKFQLGDIGHCFDLNRQQSLVESRFFVTEVDRAAECVPADGGWKLVAKGELVVEG